MASNRSGRQVPAVVAAVLTAVVLASLAAVEVAAAAGSGPGVVVTSSLDGEVAEWSPDIGYDAGDQVTFGGSLWQASWWTRGQQPGDPNGPWQEIVTTPEGEAVWTPSRSFNAGDVVVHLGVHYVAKWWTRNQLPTVPDGPWRVQHSPGVPGTPTDWSAAEEYSTGDLVRHGGHLWEAQWWAGHQEPGPLDGPWGEIAVTLQGDAVWTPTRPFDTGDEVVYEGASYAAKWWTRNQVPGDPNGPWRTIGTEAPTGARLWAPDVVFGAGDVAVHAERQYVATQASRAAEPGDPTGPWALVPDGVPLLEPPAVVGTPQVGRTVRARPGRWGGDELSFRYQWFAGRTLLVRADHRTLTVPAGARRIRVVVTALRQGAAVGSAASRAVKVLARHSG